MPIDDDISMNLKKEVVEKLQWLGSFGSTQVGGVTRLLYTKEWVDAQAALKRLFKDAGLMARFDTVGNLFGRLEGSKYKNETILTGSHVDTVKNGGFYDGQYGIIAGFLALKYLRDNYGPPVRNLEVVSMAEEEGSRFPFSFWGSKNIVDTVGALEVGMLQDFNGVSFETAMRGAGFDYSSSSQGFRDDIRAFVELHVEQGSILENENTPVGIVQQIVGQRRFTFDVRGQANHAGTTPMGYRKDAMTVASRMICAINQLALVYGDPLVATVGQLQLTPGTVNVIPGQAVFTLDVRHTEHQVLVRFTEDVVARVRAISEQSGLTVGVDMWMEENPVAMDARVVEVIRQQCEKCGVPYKLMHSGAGHDSQIMAAKIPTAMIFVPSRLGISHNPEEYTAPEDLILGIKALIGALYHLAYSDEWSTSL